MPTPLYISNPSGNYSFTGFKSSSINTSPYTSSYTGSYNSGSSADLIFLSGSSITGCFANGTYLYIYAASNSFVSGTLTEYCAISASIISGSVSSSWNNNNIPTTASLYGNLTINSVFGGYIQSSNFYITTSFWQTSSISGSINTELIISGSNYSSSISSSTSGSNWREIHIHDCPELISIDLRDNPFLTLIDIQNCISFSAITLARNYSVNNITMSGNHNFNYLDISDLGNYTQSISQWLYVIRVQYQAAQGITYPSDEQGPGGVIYVGDTDIYAVINNDTVAQENYNALIELGWDKQSTPTVNSAVENWASRVLANGGPPPSKSTKLALSLFHDRLTSDVIMAQKFKIVNCFVPDSLTACFTPLINSGSCGYGLWVNTSFSSSDLTVAGLKGNGNGKWLDTGFIPSMSFSNNKSVGISMCNSFSDVNNVRDVGTRPSSNSRFTLGSCMTGNIAEFCAWNDNAIVSGAGLTGGVGFTSGNSSNVIQWAYDDDYNLYGITGSVVNSGLYVGSSTVPLKTVASSTSSLFGVLPNTKFAVFYTLNVYSRKRISFLAIHDGLTYSEAARLNSLVQYMRTQLGGGYSQTQPV